VLTFTMHIFFVHFCWSLNNNGGFSLITHTLSERENMVVTEF